MNARMIAVAVLCLLVLAACNKSDTLPVEPEVPLSAARSEGPFIFGNHGVTQEVVNYGLVSETGEILLPIVYPILEPVYYLDSSAKLPLRDGRYYAAGIVNPAAQRLEPDHDDYLYALVSPSAELLTDFVFADIVYLSEGVIIGQPALEPGLVTIDPLTGSFSPFDYDALALSLQQKLYRRYREWTGDIHAPGVIKTGPDVPAGGFDQVVENADGTYFGGRLSGDGYTFFHYMPEGIYVDGRSFDNVAELGDGFVTAAYYEGEVRHVGLYREGRLLTDFSHRHISHMGDYLLLQDDRFDVVWDADTLATLLQVEATRGIWIPYGRLVEDNEGTVFYMNDREASSYVMDIASGEVLYESRDGCHIEEVIAGGSYFIVRRNVERTSGLRAYLFVSAEGELVFDADGIYSQFGYVVAWDYIYPNRNHGGSLYGLHTLSGETLLAREYSSMRILDGAAARVVRGDTAGIIDLAGNWIYRESVYKDII